jgi:hypothetical protein
MSDFDFDQWLVAGNFEEETIEKLHSAKVKDIDSLCLLSQYDITALKLDIGERGKFRRALRLLRVQYPDEKDVPCSDAIGDDSFDSRDPEHLAVQQLAQLESLKKIQVDQDRLTLQQSNLLASQTPASVGQGSSASSLDQLTALLSTLNLTIVPSVQVPSVTGAVLQQPPIQQAPVEILRVRFHWRLLLRFQP